MNNPQKGIDPLTATTALDRAAAREWHKKYDPKAVKLFSKPAQTCTLCGAPMHIHPMTREEYVINLVERKWSTHEHCMESATDELDRSQNIGSTRK